MSMLDILIERYDLAVIKSLENEEIILLWNEVLHGLDILTTKLNFECLQMMSENYDLFFNFISELINRGVLKDSD
jgi:hypothetical protein